MLWGSSQLRTLTEFIYQISEKHIRSVHQIKSSNKVTYPMCLSRKCSHLSLNCIILKHIKDNITLYHINGWFVGNADCDFQREELPSDKPSSSPFNPTWPTQYNMTRKVNAIILQNQNLMVPEICRKHTIEPILRYLES